MKETLLLVGLLLAVFLQLHAQTSNFEYTYYSCISTFKTGLSSEYEFSNLYKRLDDLEDDIEDALEDDAYNYQLKSLHTKVEAVAAFVGEISPDSRNFFLSMEQMGIALKELGLDFYMHDEDKFCLPSISIDLWNRSYQALFLVNASECLYRFNATIVYDYNEATKTAATTRFSGGVDYNTVRCIDNIFMKKDRDLILYELSCTKTEHCNWRNR